LTFNRENNFIDPFPQIRIFGLSVNDLKTLKNVDNVINAASLDSKLLRALVEKEHPPSLAPVEAQKSSAQLTQTFFLPTVLLS
jgi:hypothetical protein